MTEIADLERGYRRWLRWYPASFRREYEAEMLGVLMAHARAGQQRPEPMECLDVGGKRAVRAAEPEGASIGPLRVRRSQAHVPRRRS
jgi:hypothetical protein